MNGAMVFARRDHGMKSRCTKRCYASIEDAMRNAERELERDGFNGSMVRAYRCPQCRRYHLTTKQRGGRNNWVKRNG